MLDGVECRAPCRRHEAGPDAGDPPPRWALYDYVLPEAHYYRYTDAGTGKPIPQGRGLGGGNGRYRTTVEDVPEDEPSPAAVPPVPVDDESARAPSRAAVPPVADPAAGTPGSCCRPRRYIDSIALSP